MRSGGLRNQCRQRSSQAASRCLPLLADHAAPGLEPVPRCRRRRARPPCRPATTPPRAGRRWGSAPAPRRCPRGSRRRPGWTGAGDGGVGLALAFRLRQQQQVGGDVADRPQFVGSARQPPSADRHVARAAVVDLDPAALGHGDRAVDRRPEALVAADDAQPASGGRRLGVGAALLDQPHGPVGDRAGRGVAAVVEVEEDVLRVVAEHVAGAVRLGRGDRAHGGGEAAPGAGVLGAGVAHRVGGLDRAPCPAWGSLPAGPSARPPTARPRRAGAAPRAAARRTRRRSPPTPCPPAASSTGVRTPSSWAGAGGGCRAVAPAASAAPDAGGPAAAAGRVRARLQLRRALHPLHDLEARAVVGAAALRPLGGDRLGAGSSSPPAPSPGARSGAASKALCSASMAAITTLAVEANSRTPPSSLSA